MIEYPTISSFLIGFLLLSITTSTAPQQQLMKAIPGYPSSYTSTHRVWSGYLQTSSSQRSLHYIFMQSLKDGQDNNLPVVVWLNGGPGCTSKLGFLQQIAPYYMNDGVPYKLEDKLEANPFSWLNLTNLLFIDSPAGVGYSLNSDKSYKYNDVNTAKDNIVALTSFYKKFDGYRKNYLILSGQSYAGKYIPDLAVSIDNYNAANPSQALNLKGLLIGNGVIDFQSGSLFKSQRQFMIQHNFIDKKLADTYQRSCLKDSQSAGCYYFNTRYDDLVKYIDPFNIYGPCYNPNANDNKNSQKNFLLASAKFFSTPTTQYEKQEQQSNKKLQILNNLKTENCFYGKGITDYFTQPNNIEAFHSKSTRFQICSDEIYANYEQTPTGSINQMSRIISQNKLKVYLFNGDWDGVVPLLDTLKNMDKLALKQQGRSVPWRVNGQHAGFIRTYNNNFKIYTVKGAGRSVPQFQRERTYDMLQKFLSQL